MEKKANLLELNKNIYEQMSFAYSAFISLNLTFTIINFVLVAIIIASLILIFNSTFPIVLLFLASFFISLFVFQELIIFHITFRKKYFSKIKKYVKVLNGYTDLFVFFYDIIFNLDIFNVNEKLYNEIKKSSNDDLFEKLKQEKYIDNLKNFIDIITDFKNDKEISIYIEHLSADSVITNSHNKLIDLYTKLINQHDYYTEESLIENNA